MSILSSDAEPATDLETARDLWATYAASWPAQEQSREQYLATLAPEERAPQKQRWAEEDTAPDCVFYVAEGDSDCGYVRSLDDLNLSLSVYRADLSTDSLALRYYSKHGGPPFDAITAEREPEEPHHWFVVEDLDRDLGRAPVKLTDTDSARMAFALRWRESHRALQGREVVAVVSPGKRLFFALWHHEKVNEAGIRQIVREMNGNASRPRFVAVAYPFTGDGDSVHMPAEGLAAPTSLRDRQSAATAITGRPTGITALDAVLSGGYLPSDALVAFGGANGQGKTTSALEALENLATEPESLSLYVVLDEPELPIRARRLQRRGMSREAARAALGSDAEKAIDSATELIVITMRAGELFEDLLAEILQEADGRQVNIVIDSIQKLATRDGAGKAATARVSAASQALRAAVLSGNGKLRILFTSEVARGTGELKESGSLDFDADLILITSMNEAEDRLAFDVRKNRYGDKAELTVGLDRTSQRLFDPAEVKAAAVAEESDARVWAAVQRVLKERAPLSRVGVETWVTGKSATIRRVLADRSAAGDLVHEKQGYRLA